MNFVHSLSFFGNLRIRFSGVVLSFVIIFSWLWCGIWYLLYICIGGIFTITATFILDRGTICWCFFCSFRLWTVILNCGIVGGRSIFITISIGVVTSCSGAFIWFSTIIFTGIIIWTSICSTISGWGIISICRTITRYCVTTIANYCGSIAFCYSFVTIIRSGPTISFALFTSGITSLALPANIVTLGLLNFCSFTMFYIITTYFTFGTNIILCYSYVTLSTLGVILCKIQAILVSLAEYTFFKC